MSRLLVIVGLCLLAAGAWWLVWQRSRGPARVAFEVGLASRRAQAIADEAARRIRGFDARPYPGNTGPSPLGPTALILSGIAATVFGIGGAAESSSTDAATGPLSSAPQPRSGMPAKTTNQTTALMVRRSPTTATDVVGELGPGSDITVMCWTKGQPVYGDGVSSDVWHQISQPYSGWVSGRYVRAPDAEPPC